MGKHDELIAGLEAATEGSRELDLALFRELGAPLPDIFGSLKLDLTWQADGTATMPVGDMQVRYTPPAYTTSLDAIVALIERELPECVWRVGFDPDYGTMLGSIVGAAPICASGLARHDDPKLALCIALLRALSREAGHGG